jgi:ADP-heptose:LPS heptosyltransferase
MAIAESPDDVYVLRALGLGDLLTAVPALRGLRRHFPQARLILAAPPALEALARFACGVDELVPTAGLCDTPLGFTPALAVNLHGSGPESIELLQRLEPLALLTHRHPDYPDVSGPPWRPELHEVQRWCSLLSWAGITCDSSDLAIGRPPGFPDRGGVVVVHPGAASPSRRWPAERFAAVAAALHADGNDVVVTGSAGERRLAVEVARSAGLSETAVLAGELDILGMVALVSASRMVVCGDTGVAHVATATGTPSVLLFGPTPPSRWGPRSNGPHRVLWAGDVGDPHADQPHSGLLLLTTARVIGASRALLKECA